MVSLTDLPDVNCSINKYNPVALISSIGMDKLAMKLTESIQFYLLPVLLVSMTKELSGVAQKLFYNRLLSLVAYGNFKRYWI